MNDYSYNLLEKQFNLSKPQVLFANYIMAECNNNYKEWHEFHFSIMKKSLKDIHHCSATNDDYQYTLDQLVDNFYFIEREPKHGDLYRLTIKGKEILSRHNEFMIYLAHQIRESYEEAKEMIIREQIQDEINKLTIKELKHSIFKLRWFWAIIIIEFVLSVIAAFIVVKISN